MRKELRILIVLLGMLFPFLAQAEEVKAEQEEPSFFDKVDASFGKYFVGPLASIMFYDIYFWDNTLAMGDGVDTVIDDQHILRFENGEYIFVEQSSLPISTVLTIPEKEERKGSAFLWSIEVNQGDFSKIDVSIPETVVQTLEVKLTPMAEWKGELTQTLASVDGMESFVTEELTATGVPVVIDRPIVVSEDTEELPPYQIRAQKLRLEREVLLKTEEAKAGEAVAYQQAGAWIQGTLFSIKDNVKTRFVKSITEPGDTKFLLGQKVERNQFEDENRRVKAEGEVPAKADGSISRQDQEERLAIIDSVKEEKSASIYANPKNISLPIVVIWLILGAIYFTFKMNFINLRGFVHAIRVVKGDYDDEDKVDVEGEVSHFQALSSALSATVGLGNIAGVAIAVSVGGPGAIFWMVVAGFLGMSSKFTECSLGQMYRRKDGAGSTLGGPMCYLNSGLKELGMGKMGKVLAVIFAIMCIGGSFGGGNMFQANQSYVAVAEMLPFLGNSEYGSLVYGIVLAGLTGIVILGGIKSIGRVAEIIVPVMCGIYLLAGGYILLYHAADVPGAFSVIFSEAFSTDSAFGGLIGALIQGFRRAAFSNEAGVGSASIAHSAAATDEPISEGIVALLEPFIDTIVVCTMTGLVVVITGAYLDTSLSGVEMTSAAFGSVISRFPMVLSLAVFFFAFSTMISWSYYGERCATYLFGDKATTPYKIVFLLFVIMGSTIKLGNVLDFSDLMILGMAFPNILGLFLLSGKVRTQLDDYWGRLQSGELDSKKS